MAMTLKKFLKLDDKLIPDDDHLGRKRILTEKDAEKICKELKKKYGVKKKNK